MNARPLKVLAALVLTGAVSGPAVVTVAAEPPSGGDFTLRRSTMDSGGGESGGGGFTLRGTIGQADTAVMTGGAFTLRSGFWIASTMADGEAPELIFSDGFESP